MISPAFFTEQLAACNIDFYAGVPDSLLKSLCAYLTDNSLPQNNIIAANEGAAIGLAAGHHLSTGKIPVVYMQNSGLGNAMNPLISLADEDVYNIPVLLIIGWRGEPGFHDEPQHVKQGKVTIPMLDSVGIRNVVMAEDEAMFSRQLDEAYAYMRETNKVYAFVVRKDTFNNYSLQSKKEEVELPLSRELAIKEIVDKMEKDAIVVSTTGMISRELFEIREKNGQTHEKDFLTVGSMGHASQIALGIALQKPSRTVYCIDGDGASIMHMGSMGIVGQLAPDNYVHIVLNNGAHDSVGGQPTVGFQIDFPSIARACGYKTTVSVTDLTALSEILDSLHTAKKPAFVEIKVRKGARKDLGRPTISPVENKNNYMKYLSE